MNMNILAFDCSGQTLSVAVAAGGELAASSFQRDNRNHAPHLVPTIDALLQEADLPPSKLDLIAVTVGPGSFTGLRIGLATAKGFGDTLGVPLLGLPSLDVLAGNLSDERAVIVPLLDARKNQAYLGVYDNRENMMSRVLPAVPLTPTTELAPYIASYEQIVFFGEALPLWREPLREYYGDRARFGDEDTVGIRGDQLIKCALAAPPSSYTRDLEPLYLRGVDAKAKFREVN